MTVYADLYLLMNAVFDFFLLLLAGYASKKHTSFFRLLIAALIGGGSALGLLFLPGSFRLIVIFLVPPSMLLVAYGRMSPKEGAFMTLLFFGSAFLFGGAIQAILPHIRGKLSPPVLFFLLFGLFFLALSYTDVLTDKVVQTDVTLLAELCGGKTRKLRLLCDSGNLLREPISGLPVILVSASVFDAMIPPSVLLTQDGAVCHKKRLVPLRTAAGNDVITAVMPKSLSVGSSRGAKTVRAMLGRAKETKDGDLFSGYDGVIPAYLIHK